jgi:hypothetical protein
VEVTLPGDTTKTITVRDSIPNYVLNFDH